MGKADLQKILLKNEPAPYVGVLVPEDQYKKMWGDIEAGDKFKTEYLICDMEKEIIEKTESKNKTLFLVLAFSFGLILGGSAFIILR